MICCWRMSMLFHPTPHVMFLHSWKSLCIQSVHISDKSERQMPSQPKWISDFNSAGLRFWHTRLPFPSTVILNHQLWTFGAWSDLDQNAQHAFRNQWPLKCDCELYLTRMALPGPSQRKLPKDAMLENSGHLLTCSLRVRLSAFIYLLGNHLEELPQSSLPSTQTHTLSYST